MGEICERHVRFCTCSAAVAKETKSSIAKRGAKTSVDDEHSPARGTCHLNVRCWTRIMFDANVVLSSSIYSPALAAGAESVAAVTIK